MNDKFSALDIANKIKEALTLSGNRKAELNISWFETESEQYDAEYESSIVCCLSEMFDFCPCWCELFGHWSEDELDSWASNTIEFYEKFSK